MFRCYLALGSNLGDRMEHLRAGLSGLEARGVRILRTASIYSTEPQGIRSQPWFLNTVAEAETESEPEDLMRDCLEVESTCQRHRDVPNGPRTLDIDIILFEDRIIGNPHLTIPHPRYTERRFVLEPLFEIAPEQMDPARKQTVRQLLETVQDTSTISVFAPPPGVGPRL